MSGAGSLIINYGILTPPLPPTSSKYLHYETTTQLFASVASPKYLE